MRIPLKIIPQETIDAYNLTTMVDHQGWIYMRTEKGMYGLKQSGIIANQELVKHMNPFGIIPYSTHLACGSMITKTPYLVLG